MTAPWRLLLPVFASGLALLPLDAAARPVTGRSASRPTVPANYFHNVRAWHTPTPNTKAPRDAKGRTKLVLYSLYMKDRVALTAETDEGGFSFLDKELAAYIFREGGSNNQYPVEPRLLDLLYRIQLRFDAQEIRVLSGFRTPVPGKTSHGNHGKGRAVDFVVPGVADDEVVRFAREMGFVGVGIYPTSGFMHLDVRTRSYFWMDRSGPGRVNRERGILGDLARRSDEKALARGEKAPYVIPAAQEAEDDEDGD